MNNSVKYFPGTLLMLHVKVHEKNFKNNNSVKTSLYFRFMIIYIHLLKEQYITVATVSPLCRFIILSSSNH